MWQEAARNGVAYGAFAGMIAMVALAFATKKEWGKTFAFVAVALGLTGAATFHAPGTGGADAFFNDQGERFFPEFDPLDCTSMEVVGLDATTNEIASFKVMRDKDGHWIIPSHHDYPADAKDRLRDTAVGVAGLLKDTIRSDNGEEQKLLGVIDPTESKSRDKEGIGKRVTLKNKSDVILADFIIGKEVPGRTGQRYVRVPGKKRTYGVNVTVDLSTRFSDWIETNLLKVEATRVRKLIFDSHKFDPGVGRLAGGDVVEVDRKEGTGLWTMEGLKDDQEVAAEKIDETTNALRDLKILGVRMKPEGVTADLKLLEKLKKSETTMRSIYSLRRYGFYAAEKDGQVVLISNQGDVYVGTDEGVRYTLRFGDVTFASGDALSAGEDQASPDTPKKDEKGKAQTKDAAKKPEGAVESRYLMVTVDLDPSLIPEPEKPAKPELPEDVFGREPNDPKRIAEEKAEQERLDKEKTERETKLADARKRVNELTERFGPWYYVVPGDSYRAIMLKREDVARKKGEKPATPPNMPGGLNLPPGMNLPPGFGLPGGGGRLPPGHP